MTAAAVAKITLQDLHKAFDSKVVLDGLDLAVNEGESVVLVGGSGSGSGKTGGVVRRGRLRVVEGTGPSIAQRAAPPPARVAARG